jgi:phage host-nuclease inhibitor protein Gam
MKKAKNTTTIGTREELEARMGDLARRTIERTKLAAGMNAKLAEIRVNYEARFAELDQETESILADLEAWAALHGGEFGAKRSLELVHGVLGFRTGNPALKPLKGVRWEDVMALLQCRARQYIRVTEEPDKALLLADRDALGADGLAQLGLRVEQADRFYAEPRIEQEAP